MPQKTEHRKTPWALPNLAPYVAWLKTEGYQPSTINATLHEVFSACSALILWDSDIPHIRRYLRFVEQTKKNPLGPKFLEHCAQHNLTPSKRGSPSGRRVRKPISSAQWAELRTALRQDGDDTSKMLVAYMFCDLRIMKFLGQQLGSATDSIAPVITDKRSRDWLLSYTEHAFTTRRVYELLGKTPRAAYARMRRKLQDFSVMCRINVDLDTLYRSRPSAERVLLERLEKMSRLTPKQQDLVRLLKHKMRVS